MPVSVPTVDSSVSGANSKVLRSAVKEMEHFCEVVDHHD